MHTTALHAAALGGASSTDLGSSTRHGRDAITRELAGEGIPAGWPAEEAYEFHGRTPPLH